MNYLLYPFANFVVSLLVIWDSVTHVADVFLCGRGIGRLKCMDYEEVGDVGLGVFVCVLVRGCFSYVIVDITFLILWRLVQFRCDHVTPWAVDGNENMIIVIVFYYS